MARALKSLRKLQFQHGPWCYIDLVSGYRIGKDLLDDAAETLVPTIIVTDEIAHIIHSWETSGDYFLSVVLINGCNRTIRMGCDDSNIFTCVGWCTDGEKYSTGYDPTELIQHVLRTATFHPGLKQRGHPALHNYGYLAEYMSAVKKEIAHYNYACGLVDMPPGMNHTPAPPNNTKLITDDWHSQRLRNLDNELEIKKYRLQMAERERARELKEESDLARAIELSRQEAHLEDAEGKHVSDATEITLGNMREPINRWSDAPQFARMPTPPDMPKLIDPPPPSTSYSYQDQHVHEPPDSPVRGLDESDDEAETCDPHRMIDDTEYSDEPDRGRGRLLHAFFDHTPLRLQHKPGYDSDDEKGHSVIYAPFRRPRFPNDDALRRQAINDILSRSAHDQTEQEPEKKIVIDWEIPKIPLRDDNLQIPSYDVDVSKVLTSEEVEQRNIDNDTDTNHYATCSINYEANLAFIATQPACDWENVSVTKKTTHRPVPVSMYRRSVLNCIRNGHMPALKHMLKQHMSKFSPKFIMVAINHAALNGQEDAIHMLCPHVPPEYYAALLDLPVDRALLGNHIDAMYALVRNYIILLGNGQTPASAETCATLDDPDN